MWIYILLLTISAVYGANTNSIKIENGNLDHETYGVVYQDILASGFQEEDGITSYVAILNRDENQLKIEIDHLNKEKYEETI